MDKTLARRRLAHLITNFQKCRHQPQRTCERVAGYWVSHAVAHDGGRLYGHRHCWCQLGQHVYPLRCGTPPPSVIDARDVSYVIYYVIAVRARRMVRIFFLPYLANRSKSDPCSYELYGLESYILSFPKVLQIPPESPCILVIFFLCLFLFCSFVFCFVYSVFLYCFVYCFSFCAVSFLFLYKCTDYCHRAQTQLQ